MNEGAIVDTKVLAQGFREAQPPHQCPLCRKSYRSLSGILYHIGQFRTGTGVPRCVLGEETPRGSPARHCGSPCVPASSSRRKTPKREALTWAESQRLVEVEFDCEYKRVEIDVDLTMVGSISEEERGSDRDESPSSRSTHRTPQRRGRNRVTTLQQQGKSASKNKRRSKLKTPSGGADQQVKLPDVEVTTLDNLEFSEAPVRDSVYFRYIEQSAEEMDEMVEYDMDEEDSQWLLLINEERKMEGLTSVPQEAFELLMDRLEKECVFESHAAGDKGDANPYNIDENAVCCICSDGECHNTNAILFCDMCNLAVHQECYGVPYIPEGQWLCRRCLQSPSCSVDCVLCPNKGGAFKQTVDGKWAHVICALWIPEVQFANTVFLEPIDGIHNVPSARWKLSCYICRKRSYGACIQCAKTNCYTAFHVTCAQQAGLFMKIELMKGGEIKKTAFCDCHTPLSARKKLLESLDADNDSAISSEKEDDEGGEGEAVTEGDGEGKNLAAKSESRVVKRARRMLEEQRAIHAPVVNLPYVPQHRLDRIISRVSLHKKSQFIPKLVNYWKLKRQSRNGVPLLRRLQANNKGQKTAVSMNLTEEEREALVEQIDQWKELRHGLERARLLVELVRKREKLKREQLRMMEEITRLSLTPLEVMMKRVLNKLAAKDPADIFAEPVPVDDVPDYLDVIRHPMDFGTMRQKVEQHQYTVLSEFEQDFNNVWSNAMVYNAKDTIYYRAAVRIRDAGMKILDGVWNHVDSAGVSSSTGMHDPDVAEPPPLTPTAAAFIQQQPPEMFTREGEYAEERVVKTARDRLGSSTIDEQYQYLEEQLSVIDSQFKGAAKKSQEKRLRKEMAFLKRKIKKRDMPIDNGNTPVTSPPRRRMILSPPRDAEGLASQLRHGSLRITASRRAILSSSGIRLEQQQVDSEEEEETRERVTSSSGSSTSCSTTSEQSRDTIEQPAPPDEEEEEEEEEEVEERPVVKTKRRRRNRSYPMACDRPARKRQSRANRQRLPSNRSEEIPQVNGVERPRTRQLSRSIRSPSIEIASDEESQSPFFDHGEGGVPSASSVESLTRKRTLSASSDDAAAAAAKKAPQKGGEKLAKGMNGVGITTTKPLQPLDLVWAKCRGYPPYPALVIDPDMPSEGMRVNGEFIQAPSEEVLGYKEKTPQSTILVRFFDGRRTWQWLPPSKVEYLGVNKEFDRFQITGSGASKRSVQQAYERALRYQRKVMQSNADDSDCSSAS